MTLDILMVGVGGQGIVLASNILCDTVLKEDLDVKKSEIHGMAQRGGSVVSHIRIGSKVYSPVISVNSADFIVSFEKMEYLRYLDFVKDSTVLILSKNKLYPPGVAAGEEEYPNDLIVKNKKLFRNVYVLDANKIAENAGNIKVGSMALLGKLASLLPFKKMIWEETILRSVPEKTVDNNLAAFLTGFNS